MTEYFSLLFPSEKVYFFKKNFPNAFKVLYVIGERARRYQSHPDGLIIGDAIDPFDLSLSEKSGVPNV